MTEVQALARFITLARFEELSEHEVTQLKIRLLDSVGVALAARDQAVPQAIHRFLETTGRSSCSRLLGGGASSMAHAAFYNSCLVGYLDYNDSILTLNETFHPSDVIGGCLAFADGLGVSGQQLLAAIALSYEIQTRLSEAAPVRAKGFDHVIQLGYGATGAFALLLGLSESQTAHALAISGTANNPLGVSRTSLSEWKGLASAYTVFNAAQCALLAAQGITGPSLLFEGASGFKEVVSGDFVVDWQTRHYPAVTRSLLKEYNADVHSQSAIEGILELRKEKNIQPDSVRSIEIQTFDVAYHLIGTKEQADHSLRYLIAIALLDGEVGPAQFTPDRINAPDVQSPLQKISVSLNPDLSRRFPEQMPARLTVHMQDGDKYMVEKQDYAGFTTRPMTLEDASRKFCTLTNRMLAPKHQQRVLDSITGLDNLTAREFIEELLL